MARKALKRRGWTPEHVRTLKTLARKRTPGAGRTFFGSKKACVIEVFTTSRYSSMQDAKLPIRHVENPGNLISVRCRTLPEIELSCRRAGRF
jgi:hypothetical protein